jgi:hypothetical protein
LPIADFQEYSAIPIGNWQLEIGNRSESFTASGCLKLLLDHEPEFVRL